eukprot:403342120
MKSILNLAGTALLALGLVGFVQADIERGLSQDFSDWLNKNGYSGMNFGRADLEGGAYGGKASADEQIKHNPVIFFHGNSDVAVGTNPWTWQKGFTQSIEYFLSQGYTKGELYVTTWGAGNQLMSSQNYHSQEFLTYLRKFTEAVIAYTNATKINVIGHSMGVTLGRRVIKGGDVKSTFYPFNLGPSLADKVDTFIGIAGANYGLVTCQYVGSMMPTCNTLNGFYPGTAKDIGLASFLKELNDDTTKEADHVFAMFSTQDDLIMYGDLVFGQYTSMFPTVDTYKMFTTSQYTHINMRDLTKDLQYQLIQTHAFTSEKPSQIE